MGRETKPSGSDSRPEQEEDDHLGEVDDGCGCVEIWEHLADQRRKDRTS